MKTWVLLRRTALTLQAKTQNTDCHSKAMANCHRH